MDINKRRSLRGWVVPLANGTSAPEVPHPREFGEGIHEYIARCYPNFVLVSRANYESLTRAENELMLYRNDADLSRARRDRADRFRDTAPVPPGSLRVSSPQGGTERCSILMIGGPRDGDEISSTFPPAPRFRVAAQHPTEARFVTSQPSVHEVFISYMYVLHSFMGWYIYHIEGMDIAEVEGRFNEYQFTRRSR
jgi:hypothetical protein